MLTDNPWLDHALRYLTELFQGSGGKVLHKSGYTERKGFREFMRVIFSRLKLGREMDWKTFIKRAGKVARRVYVPSAK